MTTQSFPCLRGRGAIRASFSVRPSRTHFWPRSSRGKSASGSSAWATSACPWREPSATAGSPFSGFDIDPAKVARLERGRKLHRAYPRRRRSARCAETQFEATVDFRRLDEPDVVIICVPTPLTDARDPDLTYIVNSTRAIAERLRPGQLVVLESTTYPGTTREVVLPLLAAGGLRAGRRLLSGLQPRARGPGQSSVLGSDHPQGGRRPRAGQPGAGRRPLRQGGRPGRARLQPGGGRGLQDPREHLPRHQHRPGQRTEDALLQDGHRRLGSDRGGQDQAVRLPGFLSGPRTGRATASPSTRSISPGWPASTAWPRGSSSWPARSTPPCPRMSSARSPMPSTSSGKPIKGSKITLLGMAYKKRRGRPARVAWVRADGASCCKKGAVVHYNDPHIPVLAADAPLPPPAHGQPGADSRVP